MRLVIEYCSLALEGQFTEEEKNRRRKGKKCR